MSDSWIDNAVSNDGINNLTSVYEKAWNESTLSDSERKIVQIYGIAFDKLISTDTASCWVWINASYMVANTMSSGGKIEMSVQTTFPMNFNIDSKTWTYIGTPGPTYLDSNINGKNQGFEATPSKPFSYTSGKEPDNFFWNIMIYSTIQIVVVNNIPTKTISKSLSLDVNNLTNNVKFNIDFEPYNPTLLLYPNIGTIEEITLSSFTLNLSNDQITQLKNSNTNLSFSIVNSTSDGKTKTTYNNLLNDKYDISILVNTPITQDNINDAVNLWLSNKSEAEQTYGNISDWDVSAVNDMTNLFNIRDKGDVVKNFNDDIGNWDVSNVKYMAGMFYGCASFNQDLNNWNVSNVNNMANMFYGCASFNQDLNNWDVGNVQNMENTFTGCTSFNGKIGSWNVIKVQTIDSTFSGCQNFNQDIGSWDVSSVLNCDYTFQGCKAFNNGGSDSIKNWDMSSFQGGKDFVRMFKDCSNFNQDIRSWKMPINQSGETIISFSRMFDGATTFLNAYKDYPGWEDLTTGTPTLEFFNPNSQPIPTIDTVQIKINGGYGVPVEWFPIVFITKPSRHPILGGGTPVAT